MPKGENTGPIIRRGTTIWWEKVEILFRNSDKLTEEGKNNLAEAMTQAQQEKKLQQKDGTSSS